MEKVQGSFSSSRKGQGAHRHLKQKGQCAAHSEKHQTRTLGSMKTITKKLTKPWCTYWQCKKFHHQGVVEYTFKPQIFSRGLTNKIFSKNEIYWKLGRCLYSSGVLFSEFDSNIVISDSLLVYLSIFLYNFQMIKLLDCCSAAFLFIYLFLYRSWCPENNSSKEMIRVMLPLLLDATTEALCDYVSSNPFI